MTENIETFNFVIRVPKEESAFIYFQLEANEGLCFYSTLESSLGRPYRDIELTGAKEFEQEVRRIISRCLGDDFNYEFKQ